MKILSTKDSSDLHAEFNRLTKQNVRFDMSRHFAWEAWAAGGYTIDDLRLVIAYIWRRIKAGRRERESFKLSVLIGSRDKFEDDLNMARSESAAARKPTVPHEKASVLRATGRPTDTSTNAVVTPKDIIGERDKLAKLLGAWSKENL